jgi:hypothetical protein
MMAAYESDVRGSWKLWVGAALCALVLAGCGGGGDGGSTPAPTVSILDSFGQQVGSDAGIGDGDSGADGTAGEGKAIVGGVVQVTDATGKTASATTDAQGYYRVKVTGFKEPFVAKVTAPGGKVYHSLNIKPVKVNGFITINLSGLTDKIASDVARAGGQQGASQLTPQIVAGHSADITNSLNSLRSQLAAVISAAGLDPASYDPLSAPFRPNHTGYDFVLDNTVVVVAADGSTQVSVSPNFNPGGSTGLQGTWHLTVEVGSQSVDAANVQGSSIPSAEKLAQATVASAGQVFVTAYSGYTVSVNGNQVHVTGSNTDLTIVINSFSFSNYQGCGTCGVGTQVSYIMNMNFTQSGTLNGQTVPSTTSSAVTTFRYQRVS